MLDTLRFPMPVVVAPSRQIPNIEFIEPFVPYNVFDRSPIPEYALPLIPCDPFVADSNTIYELRDYIDMGNINFAVVPLHLASKFPSAGECQEFLNAQVRRMRDEGLLTDKADIIDENGLVEASFNLRMTHFPTDDNLKAEFQSFIFGEYDDNFPKAREVQLFLEMRDDILISPAT